MTVAKRNARSLEEEIRMMMRAAGDRGSRIGGLDARACQPDRGLTPKVPQTDSTELVREDRAR